MLLQIIIMEWSAYSGSIGMINQSSGQMGIEY